MKAHHLELETLMHCLEAIPYSILITDAQANDDPIIYANQAFLKMSGYTKDEIIGKNCRFMQGNETEHQEIKKIAQAMQEKKSVEVTMTNYRKNGESFTNQLAIYPVTNNEGLVTHCIALEKEKIK